MVSVAGVVCRSYFAVFTTIGVDHWGRYQDEVRKENGDWLIGNRHIHVDGFADNSLLRVD